MSTLTKKTDRLFPDFFRDLLETDFMPANLWEKSFSKLTPSANIKENETTFTLDLAAPGLKKDDFKIEINNGVLTISAEKKEEKNEENDKFNRREFYYNSFSRSFTLPTNISENQIKASYENGLLKLIIPKLGTENNAKKIILQQIIPNLLLA